MAYSWLKRYLEISHLLIGVEINDTLLQMRRVTCILFQELVIGAKPLLKTIIKLKYHISLLESHCLERCIFIKQKSALRAIRNPNQGYLPLAAQPSNGLTFHYTAPRACNPTEKALDRLIQNI